MTAARDVLRARPILAFLVIAFAFSWLFTALVPVSIAFGLVALFGPALAATLVSAAEGRLGELRERLGWRRPVVMYLAAVAIPFAVVGAARAVHVALGGPALGLGAVSAIEVVIFVLVIGEEIGWRGFLQPRLREHRAVVVAGLLVGVAWVLWHLPLYLGPAAGPAAFLAFAWWVLPVSVVMAYLAERTRFSIIVATVLHGSANVAAPILLPGVERQWVLVVSGSIYALVAAAFVIAEAREQSRTRTHPATAV